MTTLLFALAHLAGFLQAAHAARHHPDLAELTRAIREPDDLGGLVLERVLYAFDVGIDGPVNSE